ncbi:hypothetical protein CBR_g8025 [Chara braunii]|uniref:Uncharacterized protein n=1 Tax=Chara braunii TaxID=69332 RepID=A0A388KL05_CHABU|nr:hypothetical protein CBR_g8025 [Chara braunii]|eukprot:GBG70726.1 hypothetical protein CBR_g8025 [Chara braunii]
MRAATMPPFDKSRKKDGSQVVMLRPPEFLKKINCHKVATHVCTVDSKLALSTPLIPFDILVDKFDSKLRSYRLQTLGQAILHSAISVGSPHVGGATKTKLDSSTRQTGQEGPVGKSGPVLKPTLPSHSRSKMVPTSSAPGRPREEGPTETSCSREDGGGERPGDSEKTEDDITPGQRVVERSTDDNVGRDEDETEERSEGQDRLDVIDEDACGDEDDLEVEDDTEGGGDDEEGSYEGGSEGEMDGDNECGGGGGEYRRRTGSATVASGHEDVLVDTQRSVCSRERKTTSRRQDDEKTRRQSKLIGLAASQEAYKKALETQSVKPTTEKRERPRSSQRQKKKPKVDGPKEVADFGDEVVGVVPRDNTAKPERLVSDNIDTTRCFFLEYDGDGNAIDRPAQVFVDVLKILPNPDDGDC